MSVATLSRCMGVALAPINQMLLGTILAFIDWDSATGYQKPNISPDLSNKYPVQA